MEPDVMPPLPPVEMDVVPLEPPECHLSST